MNAELQELLALALVCIVGLRSLRRYRRGRQAKRVGQGGCCGTSVAHAEHEIDLSPIARRRRRSENAAHLTH